MREGVATLQVHNLPDEDLAGLQAIAAQRVRQDRQWGESNHDPLTWLAILTEEVGEASQAALHARFGGDKSDDLRRELISVAAVALAALACLTRGAWKWPGGGGAKSANDFSPNETGGPDAL